MRTLVPVKRLPHNSPTFETTQRGYPAVGRTFCKQVCKEVRQNDHFCFAANDAQLANTFLAGNIRELANVIERAVIHTQGNVLQVVDRFEQAVEELPSATKSLEEVEREYIIRVLEDTGWRIEGGTVRRRFWASIPVHSAREC